MSRIVQRVLLQCHLQCHQDSSSTGQINHQKILWCLFFRRNSALSTTIGTPLSLFSGSGNSIKMKWEQLRPYDETVRRTLAAGDFREALDALVRGYQHVVVGFCTNMLGDTTQGEEVAQEVFLSAYRAMPSFRGQASVRTWLFAIARKQCLKTLRDRGRRSRLEHDQQQTIASTVHRQPPAAEGEDPEVKLRLVKQGLSQLDKAQRALLMMHYDTGLPVAEIAHILGISPVSVRRRLARALQRLREVIRYDA
jgi:RNA polymerase sigma-70 factor (ECF subfamily)